MTSENLRPTSVNQDLVGQLYGPATYEVTAVKIREFAAATAATSPLHHDVQAARNAGYRDLLAPPTFAVIPAQQAEAAYVGDPQSGIDFSRVVHAEEHFTHHRSIQAGDTLQTTVEVKSIVVRGPLSLVTTIAHIETADGQAVSDVTSTLAVRGSEA